MAYDGSKLVWETRHVRSEKAVIGEVQYEPSGTCGPRIQKDYELVFLHSGELVVQVDGESRVLLAGEMALFLPNHHEFFEFSRTLQSHHSWCSIHPSMMPPQMQTALAQSPISLTCSDGIDGLLKMSLATGSVQTPMAKQLVDYLSLSLFAKYLEVAEELGLRRSKHQTVANAINYFTKHLHESDCGQKVHKKIGVSRSSLFQKFHHEMKTTPARHLWRLRTERGIAMLKETVQPVSEIADKCGFKNPFHFSRLVKQLQGISPRQIRSDARTANDGGK